MVIFLLILKLFGKLFKELPELKPKVKKILDENRKK